jgi:hypothetical protein
MRWAVAAAEDRAASAELEVQAAEAEALAYIKEVKANADDVRRCESPNVNL